MAPEPSIRPSSAAARFYDPYCCWYQSGGANTPPAISFQIRVRDLGIYPRSSAECLYGISPPLSPLF
jgi:hypothetical protein